MKRLLVAIALLGCAMVLFSAPAAAQGVWITRQKPLDPERAGLRDALVSLRDSLTAVTAAGAAFQRDLKGGSDAVALSRARTMHEACAAAGRTVPQTREVVAKAVLDQPNRKAQRDLLVQLDSVSRALKTCDDQFAGMDEPASTPKLRGYANAWVAQLEPVFRRYRFAVKGFFAGLKIEDTPAGANLPKLAG
jgi:hypothetical protein